MESSVSDVGNSALRLPPGTLTFEDGSGVAVIAPPRVVGTGQRSTFREMFDKQSLARYFRVSTDTVDRLVKAGELRAVRIGNQIGFTLEDVEAFIERHRIESEAA